MRNKGIWISDQLKEKDNEIFNLIKNTLDDLNIDYKIVSDIEQIEDLKSEKNIVLYYWNPDLEVNNKDSEMVNIFRN